MKSGELKLQRVTKGPCYIERLMRRYAKNPVMRALVQFLLPRIGPALDVALTTLLDRIAEGRAITFFDELSAGATGLTEENIRNEPFLHAYFATQAAAFKTMRREKIRLFARLLKTAAANPALLHDGSYEEYLRILDDLSYREMLVLEILEQCESASPSRESENEWTRTERYWHQFVEQVRAKVGISETELPGFLTRLCRSGCCETVADVPFGGPITGGRPKLTEMYRKLKSLVGRIVEEQERTSGEAKPS
jgi:hypothetical protein